MQIDHMVRGYFGWLGTFVVGAGDVVARPATNQPKRPTPDYWKVATGSIVSDVRDAPSRYVTQMYEQAKEVEQAYGTFRSLVKEGKADEAQKFFDANEAKLTKHATVQGVKKVEATLNEKIRLIERSDLTPKEKKDLIRELREQKDQVARMVN